MANGRAGFSFRNSSGQLDYAYVSGSELEQSIHWLSATLRWGTSDAMPLSEPVLTKTAEVDENVPILMPATLTIHNNVPETSIGELRASEWAISPNDDGFADSTTFHFEVGSDDKWWLILIDEYTERVWERSGSGSPAKGIVWDGIADTGNLVPDGDYEVELYVSDAQGELQLSDSKKVTVDLISTTLDLGTEHQGMPEARSQSTDAPGSKLTLMVGSFIERRYAERMKGQLEYQNPSHKVTIHLATIEDKARHRVTIGAFNKHEEAAALKKHIQETLGVEPVLITVQ